MTKIYTYILKYNKKINLHYFKVGHGSISKYSKKIFFEKNV